MPSSKGLRVLVCGGRRYADAYMVTERLEQIVGDYGITCIIEGGAQGADRLARLFGKTATIPVLTFEADWTAGKKAGPLRNQRMLDEGEPDLVVAFPGGSGTADLVRRARGAGVKILEVGMSEAAS